MSQQLRHGVDVHPTPEQPARERVPQIVNVQIFNAGIFGRVSEGY
jgi:hypothetical protein